MDFIIYYLIVGYVINNILSLIAIYTDEDVEIDFTNFILTVPTWPVTLWQVISNHFSEE